MLAANPYVLLAGALVLVASHGLVGWKAYDLGKDAVYAEKYQLEEAERRITEAADKAIAKGMSELRVKNVYTTQKLEKEVVEVPVYRDCQHSDAAFGVLNDSLMAPEERAGTEQSSGGVVPEADPAD